EHLPVTGRTGLRRTGDAIDYLLHYDCYDDDRDLHLREEVDRVFRAPVELGVPLLAAEAAHLRDRHADHADAGERLLDVVQLERLDDGLDLFHLQTSSRIEIASADTCELMRFRLV